MKEANTQRKKYTYYKENITAFVCSKLIVNKYLPKYSFNIIIGAQKQAWFPGNHVKT